MKKFFSPPLLRANSDSDIPCETAFFLLGLRVKGLSRVYADDHVMHQPFWRKKRRVSLSPRGGW